MPPRSGMSLRHLVWVLPWLERCATSDELTHRVAKDGLVLRLLLLLARRRYRRRERLIFGPDPAHHP